jgi:uncharacterized protein involved in type VI secretion and phage assembly
VLWYGFANSAAGDAQATLRMQEIEAGGKHFEAAGNDRTVQPGRWFNLSGVVSNPSQPACPLAWHVDTAKITL